MQCALYGPSTHRFSQAPLLALLATCLALPATVGAAEAIDPPASATGCQEQVLEPGQEAAIEALLALPGGVSVTGLEPGDIEVGAGSMTASFRGTLGGEAMTWTWRIAARTAASPAAGLVAMRLAPCVAGRTPDSDARVAACNSDEGRSALARADDRMARRLDEAGGSLRWRCPTAGRGDEADGAADLGAAMRDIDRLLSVADKAAADRRMNALLAGLGDTKLAVHERIDMAGVLQRLGRDEAATLQLKVAVQGWQGQDKEGQGNDVVVLERVAAAQIALGQVERGLALLETCPDRAKVDACSPLPAAGALEQAGRPDDAAALLDAAVADGKIGGTALHLARIGLASRMEAGPKELAAAKAAVEQHGDDAELLNALACAQFRAGEFEEAIASFERVYRKDPAFPGTLARLSGAFNQMAGQAGGDGHPVARWTKLRATMETRAKSDPQDVVAMFMLGVAQYYDGELEAAIASMKQVEPQVPNEARVYIYQGMGHHWLGRKEQAERLILKARKANPHDSDVYYCYSQVFHQQDRVGAIQNLKRYIAMSSAPGALQFEKKTDRVRQELALLEKGENLPDWDRPARTPVNSVPGERGGGQGWQILLWALGLLALALAFMAWRRRRG